ncbi:MAG: hypothetical protein JWR38_946 [Mucilaginibacter sp.]|nr:hypothetical protein [Mucilaginibacter sp.]
MLSLSKHGGWLLHTILRQAQDDRPSRRASFLRKFKRPSLELELADQSNIIARYEAIPDIQSGSAYWGLLRRSSSQ